MESFINKDLVVLDLKSRNKKDAINELSGILKDEGYINDIDLFVDAVYERESLGITGMGNHVAIPHGKSETVVKPGLIVGKLDSMIEWESIDDDPIDIIFMFFVNNDIIANAIHLKMLSKVACKLADDEKLTLLRNCTDVDEFIELLLN